MKALLKTIGPGLLFAGAAIGVSHLVQSTRAGANYGFFLLWAVFLGHFTKYPFFIIGPRYLAATGNNLLVGYQNVGTWALVVVLIVSFLSMFTIQAAVTLVTAGLASNLFDFGQSLAVTSSCLLILCTVILLIGKYRFLDKIIKWIIMILTLSTLAAFGAALLNPVEKLPAFQSPELLTLAGFSFLLALMGWMPAPLDISIWNSIWAEEKKKITNHQPTLKEATFDFNLGFSACILLALMFMSLGALVMHGTGETFSESGVVFAKQVVSLYTKSLGGWSYPVILIAAVTTMFSTTLTCLDAFPRVFQEAVIVLKPELKEKEEKLYFIWVLFVCAGSLVLILFFLEKMKALVDLATILSFLSAPFFAYINLRTINDPHIPEEFRFSKGMNLYAWISFWFLVVFSLTFLVWRFFLS